jgi:hypothetical protein
MNGESVLLGKRDGYFVVIHILFGFIAVVLPIFIPLLFLAVSLLYLIKYSAYDKHKAYTLLFISYLSGLEILNRSVGGSFLPYEIGKYIQIGFILVNMFFAKTWFNSFIGILIILLLIPSLSVFPSDTYKYFVFNSLGIFTLGFIIAFTAYQKIFINDFIKILKAFLFPCITFVTYITLKTPVYSEIDFRLGANVSTAGGFGSNQVATLLGASICLLVIMLDQKYYIINRLFTQVLIIYFTLRALLTFSRGGVVGMILSVLIAFLFFRKIRKDSAIKLAVLASAMVIVFLITNAITNGQLLLRYKGETTGTLAGSREKTLESFSSGRNNFAEVDLYVWADNIILGVGPGRVQFIRYKYGLYDDAPPHTEVTRLLAEDGLFGLAINLILIFWPLYVISRTPSRDMKFIKSILFIFAYATTFHSATRTGLTPLLYGLASMDIMSFDQLKSSPEYDQKI